MTIADKKIQKQLDRMDQQKQALMDLVRPLPDELYRRQPHQGSWSVGQVANHLYLSENLSLAYLKKKLSYPETIPGFSLKSLWALFLVKFTLWTKVKVKAPDKINMWGEQEVLSPEELDQKWNLVRTEMQSVISQNLPRFGSHLVYNHPFAGRMTMGQMLIFINHHFSHHLRQVRRILKKIS
jgi:uncharacterized damage-inducible protein DinB